MMDGARTLFGFGTPKEMAAAIAAAINLLLHFVLASFASFDRPRLGTALPPTMAGTVALRAGATAA